MLAVKGKSSTTTQVRDCLEATGWFEVPGSYVLVDGQFGSTGKGLLSCILSEVGASRITHVTSNAGPNSGHTAYLPGFGQKVMLQQIPVGSVTLNTLNCFPRSLLNGGSIIDIDILAREVADHGMEGKISVHPNAAIIRQQDREAEATGGPAKIASTGKGVGAALAAKIMRECNTAEFYENDLSKFCQVETINWNWKKDCVLVETSQGFSLGVNSRFYPATTSRECTVMQAVADARIPCSMVRKVAACYRTYPIRVGNTPVGYSGEGYADQEEIKWIDIGRDPELTSVTKRERRLFTWSRLQFMESVAANRPDLIFLNFMQYLDPSRQKNFIERVVGDYKAMMGQQPDLVLLGYGPMNSDVAVWNG